MDNRDEHYKPREALILNARARAATALLKRDEFASFVAVTEEAMAAERASKAKHDRIAEIDSALREERVKGFVLGVVFAVSVSLLGYAAAIGAGALLIHFGITPP